MQTQIFAGHLPIACKILCQGLGSVTLPVSGGGVGREWLKAEEVFFSPRSDHVSWDKTSLVILFLRQLPHLWWGHEIAAL